MSLKQGRYVFVFILGMLTFAVGYFIVTTFIFVNHPCGGQPRHPF